MVTIQTWKKKVESIGKQCNCVCGSFASSGNTYTNIHTASWGKQVKAKQVHTHLVLWWKVLITYFSVYHENCLFRSWLNFTSFVPFPAHPFSQPGVNFRPGVWCPCHCPEPYTTHCYKGKYTRTGDWGAGEKEWGGWIDRKWSFPVLINEEQKQVPTRCLQNPWSATSDLSRSCDLCPLKERW